MNPADSLFVAIASVALLIGFSLNLLLMYLIIWKSPRSLTPYWVFLANTTITQLLFAVVALISLPRVLSKDPYTIVIYLGVVQYMGERLSYISYVGMTHLSLNCFISLMLSMVYRYFSIRYHQFTMRTSIVVCLAGYSLPLILFLSCTNLKVSSDIDSNRPILEGVVKDFERYRMVVSTDISSQPQVIALVIAMTLGIIPIYGALTLQSLIPLVSVIPASTVFCLTRFELVEDVAYSYLIIPCLSLGCIADPIVTIRCVLPYRRWILRICHMKSAGDVTSSIHEKSKSEHVDKGVRRIFLRH
uniref:G protein-coupled receptor n=1 Tax=Caenorhabditis japonica TaxID=281687 RepID=A0A8R1HPG3_CAEJA